MTTPVDASGQVPTFRVAVVGAEGSGKTVLLATLAKYFGQSQADGISLQAFSNETVRFVESNWQSLADGHWPDKTPIGRPTKLLWRLTSQGESPFECQLEIIDAAGQDWLEVPDEASARSDVPRLGPPTRLECQLDWADVVICLVNLADFVGEPDKARRLENEIFVASVLRRVRAKPQGRIGLLFSQADLYCKSVMPHFGDWRRVAQHYLPNVHGAFLATAELPVHVAAAVDKLCVRTNEEGRPQRFPASAFRSAGFDRFMEWIIGDFRELQRVRDEQQRELEQANREKQEREQLELSRQASERRELIVGSIIMVIALVAAGCGIAAAWNWLWPAAPQLTLKIDRGTFSDDLQLTNDSERHLAQVRVTLLVVDQHTNELVREVALPAQFNWRSGETRTWTSAEMITRSSQVRLRIDSYRYE